MNQTLPKCIWRDKLIKVNWKSNLERHIQNFHREAKIVSKVTVDDEMKDEEKCQNIEEIPATDENVSDNEMQMDTDKRAEIQMDTAQVSGSLFAPSQKVEKLSHPF